MNVRYFTVARDEYEGGSCPTCARCGSAMRHVTSVNGTLYGSNCGKIVIVAARRAEGKRAALIAEAGKVISATLVPVLFDSWTMQYINERIESCDRAERPLLGAAWRLILQAKTL